MTNRSEFKDNVAKVILHGGYFVGKTAILTAAVTLGLIDKSMCKIISKHSCRWDKNAKIEAWNIYEKTGNIGLMLNSLTGF